MTQQQEILDDPNYIPLLDHGFVGILDHMGDDLAVVEAARVSYGAGTRSVREDRGLIRYLFRHRHSSPIEMTEVKFHLKLPIIAMRQLIRHRTACLTGDTKLTFDLPAAVARGKYRSHPLTIKDVYDRFQPTSGEQGNPHHKRDRVKDMLLRSCNEKTLEVYHTHITDIWQNGVKPVIKVRLTDTDVLRATGDHQCFTDHGWLSLKEALAINAKFACFKSAEGYLSKDIPFTEGELADEQWLEIANYDGYEVSSLGRVRSSNNRLSNLGFGDALMNAQDRMETGCDQRLSIQFLQPLSWEEDGEEMTYDLSVSGPFYNFSANNAVVHNSANEYSGRYSIMSDEFYIPSLDVIMPQSTDNKQGRAGEMSEKNKQGVQWMMNAVYESAYDCYQALLGEKDKTKFFQGDVPYGAYDEDDAVFDQDFSGVARELARTVLPVANYTECYWKIDLSNLLKLLRLRTDAHAQYEIRVYADAMYTLIQPIFPLCCEAYVDYQKEAVTLSRMEVNLVREIMAGQSLEALIEAAGGVKALADQYGMSKRELDEFRANFRNAADVV